MERTSHACAARVLIAAPNVRAVSCSRVTLNFVADGVAEKPKMSLYTEDGTLRKEKRVKRILNAAKYARQGAVTKWNDPGKSEKFLRF